jgi:hypothetical protein
VAPHEPRALKNHDQTLEELNERGGADPSELMAILENRHWHRMDPQAAGDQLAKFVLDAVARMAVAIANAAVQPEPTELQQVLAMFDRAGVKYERTDERGIIVVMSEAGTGPANKGYVGFSVGLEFDAAGALLTVGAWE